MKILSMQFGPRVGWLTIDNNAVLAIPSSLLRLLKLLAIIVNADGDLMAIASRDLSK